MPTCTVPTRRARVRRPRAAADPPRVPKRMGAEVSSTCRPAHHHLALHGLRQGPEALAPCPRPSSTCRRPPPAPRPWRRAPPRRPPRPRRAGSASAACCRVAPASGPTVAAARLLASWMLTTRARESSSFAQRVAHLHREDHAQELATRPPVRPVINRILVRRLSRPTERRPGTGQLDALDFHVTSQLSRARAPYCAPCHPVRFRAARACRKPPAVIVSTPRS